MGLDVKSRFRQSLMGIYRKALADDVEGPTSQSNDRSLDESCVSKYSANVLAERTRHFKNRRDIIMFSNSSLPPSSKNDPNNMVTEAIMETIKTVLVTLTVVFGITGNSVVIWVAGFKLKQKVINVWLVNLAIADFIFCITRVFSLIKKLFFDHWPFGEFLCRFHGFFKYANMFCSVFLLAVISLDRMLCVWRPFFAKQHRTLCAARVVAVCVWIAAILLSSPFLFYSHFQLGENNKS
ncbi:hypothetical protein CCH79_00014181, partial [Gambusia affinis]